MDFSKEDMQKFGALTQQVINLKEQVESVVKNFTARFDKLEKLFEKFMEEDRKKITILFEVVDRIDKRVEKVEEKHVEEDKSRKVKTQFMRDSWWKLPAFILGSSAILGAIFDFLYRIPPK